MKRRTPRAVAVTGHRNSGKTTAIEGLLRELGRRGWKVGTIKHCHKNCDVDRPGKDSWRHREAGAARTALMTPDGLAVFAPAGEDDPRALVPLLFPDMDLVLVEGFHWLPLDRIEVRDSAGRVRPAHPEGRLLADLPHHFDGGTIVELADLLAAGTESPVRQSVQDV